jgi:hypothetical protein
MQFIKLLNDKEQELKLADYRKFSFLFSVNLMQPIIVINVLITYNCE